MAKLVHYSIEKLYPSGMLKISAMANDECLFTRRYMGYTRREALRNFKADLKTFNERNEL